MDSVTPPEYYQHLYPYDLLVSWLTSQGHALQRFEFAMEGKTSTGESLFKRYVVAKTAADLRKQIGSFPGIAAFHVGGIYPDMCTRRSAPTQRMFSIDIDLTDYDFLKLTDAHGAVSPLLCDKAYPVAAFALFVLRHLLERAFGFRQILFCYSGRRGVHLHVMDASALALNNEARGAVATFMNLSYSKGGKRASSSTRGIAKMYDLVDPAMAAFSNTLVGEMDLFDSLDQRVQFVERLELKHASLTTLVDDVIDQETGAGAWELIRSRVLTAGVSWFKERLLDTVLAYVWPRMDENVTTIINHLIKAPFCAHAKSHRVAVVLNKQTYQSWDAGSAPSLDGLDKDAWDRALELLKPDACNSTDMEDAVPKPRSDPRSAPRKMSFKRKQSPLVP